MNMSKSRDIQAKMPSPKVIFYAFWLVTVKVLNSYDSFIIKNRRKSGMYFLVHRMVYVVYLTYQIRVEM